MKTDKRTFLNADVLKASKLRYFARERREFVRYSIEAKASIILVKSGSVLRGDILDLSLGGCRIHCHEKFPVGIFTRVETEFNGAGMPFRLAGVIQSIHASSHGFSDVGIRFLDMSSRKREQMELLLREIEENQRPAGEGVAEAQD